MSWTKEEIKEGARTWLMNQNSKSRSRLSGQLATEFLARCEALGLNPLYDGVVAYPSGGRLTFIVEHDTIVQKAVQTGECRGIRSGTRVREDGAVIAWCEVLRGKSEESPDFWAKSYAELDVKEWQDAHTQRPNPFWGMRSQSMTEKCVRVMGVKLAFADAFYGLRDDVSSVLYEPDPPEATPRRKAQDKAKAKAKDKTEAKGKAEAKSTPIDALAKMASDAGHDIDELAKRFGCLGAADMPEGVATTIERLLSTTGLCSAAQYAAASGAISGLLSRGLSASEAQQSLMRYGRVAHRKYLTAEGADAFVGWCDNNAE